MPRIRDLLHADRVFKLMDAGLSFKDAAQLDRYSADLLIEAWEIATTSDEDDGDGDVVVMIGRRE
jgi:hypothetical protein